jgi:hypothetical protein
MNKKSKKTELRPNGKRAALDHEEAMSELDLQQTLALKEFPPSHKLEPVRGEGDTKP